MIPVGPDRAPYLAGLRLAGRRVVVVGAGAVAQRRLRLLLDTGAQVTVIAPAATPAVQRMADRGELQWLARAYEPGDLAGAWYVLVATDDERCNRAVSLEAEAQRTFCVRADRAAEATAWTPATVEVDGLTVGVLAGGDPQRARQTRDLLAGFLRRLRRLAA